MGKLSHLDAQGRAAMVDVSAKAPSARVAKAEALVLMEPSTLRLILEGGLPKGDVLAVARVAGIQAAKRTWELIPLCHPLTLSHVSIDFEPHEASGKLRIESCCRLTGQTGVEMEALSAVSIAALCVYDMCKAAQKDIQIQNVRLLHKAGGRSGSWDAPDSSPPANMPP